MIPREKHTLRDYKRAFMQFSGAAEQDFQIKKESGALAFFEGQTYRICLYDDLLKGFKSYFLRDYTLIYTETPFALWEILFKRHHEITDDDLIIDIFNAWSTYWENEQKLYGKGKFYEQSKAQSRRNLTC